VAANVAVTVLVNEPLWRWIATGPYLPGRIV